LDVSAGEGILNAGIERGVLPARAGTLLVKARRISGKWHWYCRLKLPHLCKGHAASNNIRRVGSINTRQVRTAGPELWTTLTEYWPELYRRLLNVLAGQNPGVGHNLHFRQTEKSAPRVFARETSEFAASPLRMDDLLLVPIPVLYYWWIGTYRSFGSSSWFQLGYELDDLTGQTARDGCFEVTAVQITSVNNRDFAENT